MKQYLLILLIALLSFSCDSIEKTRERRKAGEAARDSIEVAEKQARLARVDSAIKADSAKLDFYAEQEKIAFGAIKFGMTKEEVEKADKINKNGSSWIRIGDYDFSMYKFYENDSLYYIELYTLPVTANYIDTKLKEQWGALRTAIWGKYGEPKVRNGFPAFFSFDPGYVSFTDEWAVGDKTIIVFVGEESDGSRYYTGARIYNEPIYQRVSDREAAEKNSEMEEATNLF